MSPFLLLDIRSREEHESVRLPGSKFLTQELQNSSSHNLPRKRSSFMITEDVMSWIAVHGFMAMAWKNSLALEGGIDGWAREVDPSVQRYRLELD